jgi:cob(I)alamin adenosyltransferase
MTDDQSTKKQRQEKRRASKKKGLVIVNTGKGKGKSTAAFGLILRAWGRGMRVAVLQFLKNEGAQFGEIRAAKKIGIEMVPLGDGFTWTSRDMEKTIAHAQKGWEEAKARIASGDYDVLVLDEFTYLLHFEWLNTQEVIDWLRENKPPMLHLVITGRDAPQALIDFADLVTEMREIKHPFNEQDITAQPGIEF